MDNQFIEDIKNQTQLIVITDANDNIILSSDTSPVSALYKAYFRGKFVDVKDIKIYGYQVGLGIAIFSSVVSVSEIYAKQISKPGLALLNDLKVNVKYDEEIELVKSSKNPNEVCPVERFLYEHSDMDIRWKFICDKYNNDNAPSCSIANHRK